MCLCEGKEPSSSTNCVGGFIVVVPLRLLRKENTRNDGDIIVFPANLVVKAGAWR